MYFNVLEPRSIASFFQPRKNKKLQENDDSNQTLGVDTVSGLQAEEQSMPRNQASLDISTEVENNEEEQVF